MRRHLLHASLFFFPIPCCLAQPDSSKAKELAPIIVTAYGLDRPALETPASISLVSAAQLQQYNNTSLLPAVNTSPGVRMEERSPGSYRLSIRGSALRSPFGVRNVKIYYNEIPLTDPGGFSYLNQLGFRNVASLQIIKGPGSSLYGSGNGGVLLLRSFPDTPPRELAAGFSAGSYGMQDAWARLSYGDSANRQQLSYEQMHTDGYRRQSSVQRNTVSYDASRTFRPGNILQAHVLYNNLYYQTPGGLTLEEMQQDPRAARPGSGTIPGAITQQAAIKQENLLAGITWKSRLATRWQQSTTLYGLYSQVENPAIRNYSKTTDPHFGGRTVFQYSLQRGRHRIHFHTGAELQQSDSRVSTYSNRNGNADTLMSKDHIRSTALLGFAQLSWHYGRWTWEGGLGYNRYSVNLDRLSDAAPAAAPVNLQQLTPRLALLYRLHQNHAVYLNTAKGFSPPTTVELAPSGSRTNLSLRPEYGWNYEAGFRGNAGRFGYDLGFFYFDLQQAIVLRKDSAGGDTYTNAGNTQQAGIEAQLSYSTPGRKNGVVRHCEARLSYTGYHFRYGRFIQGTADYSGNTLPGVPAHTLSATFTADLPAHFSLFASWYFSSRIALNDAGSAFAASYHLLSAKISWRAAMGKYKPELFAGADNLLNRQYSLGNDINAAGGRFYNPAMPLNIYAGFSMALQY